MKAKNELDPMIVDAISQEVSRKIEEKINRRPEMYIIPKSDPDYISLSYDENEIINNQQDVESILEFEMFNIPLGANQYMCFGYYAEDDPYFDPQQILSNCEHWEEAAADRFINANRAVISYIIESLRNVKKITTDEDLFRWFEGTEKHCLYSEGNNDIYEELVRIPVATDQDDIYMWSTTLDWYELLGHYDRKNKQMIWN